MTESRQTLISRLACARAELAGANVMRLQAASIHGRRSMEFFEALNRWNAALLEKKQAADAVAAEKIRAKRPQGRPRTATEAKSEKISILVPAGTTARIAASKHDGEKVSGFCRAAVLAMLADIYRERNDQ